METETEYSACSPLSLYVLGAVGGAVYYAVFVYKKLAFIWQTLEHWVTLLEGGEPLAYIFFNKVIRVVERWNI